MFEPQNELTLALALATTGLRVTPQQLKVLFESTRPDGAALAEASTRLATTPGSIGAQASLVGLGLFLARPTQAPTSTTAPSEPAATHGPSTDKKKEKKAKK
jgi:hypothetical protein